MSVLLSCCLYQSHICKRSKDFRQPDGYSHVIHTDRIQVHGVVVLVTIKTRRSSIYKKQKHDKTAYSWEYTSKLHTFVVEPVLCTQP